MRAFKNLDYFRKIAPEHTKPTVVGGLISLMSLTVINNNTSSHSSLVNCLTVYLLIE